MDGVQSGVELNASAARLLDIYRHQFALTQAVLDRATTGLIGLDADLQVLLCNHSAADTLGLTAPELWRPIPLQQWLANSTNLDPGGCLALETALASSSSQERHGRVGASERFSKITLIDGQVMHVTVGHAGEDHSLITLTVDTASGVPLERTDSLTGLSDRQWLHECLTTLLGSPDRAEQVAVLLIDLDRFKAVNDSQGHPVGDALLQMVAQRLSSAVRDGDLVSRLGGDEFAVTMPGLATPEAMGERLVDLLSRP